MGWNGLVHYVNGDRFQQSPESLRTFSPHLQGITLLAVAAAAAANASSLTFLKVDNPAEGHFGCSILQCLRFLDRYRFDKANAEALARPSQ